MSICCFTYNTEVNTPSARNPHSSNDVLYNENTDIIQLFSNIHHVISPFNAEIKLNNCKVTLSTHICKNITITAIEATSELSFFAMVNERECARSSEWPRLNGQISPLWFTKFTYNSTLCAYVSVCVFPGMNELTEARFLKQSLSVDNMQFSESPPGRDFPDYLSSVNGVNGAFYLM